MEKEPKFKPHPHQATGMAAAAKPSRSTLGSRLASSGVDPSAIRYEGAGETRIEEYQMNRIEAPGRGTYQDLKQRYGSLAATDEDRPPRSRKDSRFMLSPMMRDHLSIEEEEKRAIRAQIQSELEQLREQAKIEGRDEGYQAGLQQGRQEALAKFTAQGAQAIERFEAVVDQVEGARARMLKEQERALVDLVAHVGQLLALQALKSDPTYLTRLTSQLVEQIGVRENFKISISAQDAAFIAQIRADLTTRFGELKNLTVETSPAVKQGGCIIETAWNCVDASLEKQFAQIQSALQGLEVGTAAEAANGDGSSA